MCNLYTTRKSAADYDTWLRGSLDGMAFQGRCYADELIQMERTGDPWMRRRTETPTLD